MSSQIDLPNIFTLKLEELLLELNEYEEELKQVIQINKLNGYTLANMDNRTKQRVFNTGGLQVMLSCFITRLRDKFRFPTQFDLDFDDVRTDSRSEGNQESRTSRISKWPAVFLFPEEKLTFQLKTALENKQELNKAEEKDLIEILYIEMTKYGDYPGHNYRKVVQSFLLKYPYLCDFKETAEKYYHSKLKRRFHNNRSRLDTPERKTAQTKFTTNTVKQNQINVRQENNLED